MRRKHQRRVLINLLVIAVLALFLWVHEGCHLPTLEMELHRMERQRLAEESRVIWTYEGRAYNDRDMLVGISTDYIFAYVENYKLRIWPRSGDTPTLVVLPDMTRYFDAGSLLGPALIAVDPPPQAERARLFLDFTERYADMADEGDPVTLTYTLEGEQQEGLFFFQLKPRYRTLGENPTKEQQLLNEAEDSVMAFFTINEADQLSFSYTLTFYDRNGRLLETVSSPQ